MADPSILGTNISIKMTARFTPLTNPDTGNFIRSNYEINFLNSIESPLMEVSSISSDRFIVNGISCSLRNSPLHSTTLQVVDKEGNIVISDVGEYQPGTGKVILVGFLIDSIVSGNSYLRITVNPADDSSFKPLRNTLITLGNYNSIGVQDNNVAVSAVGVIS